MAQRLSHQKAAEPSSRAPHERSSVTAWTGSKNLVGLGGAQSTSVHIEEPAVFENS